MSSLFEEITGKKKKKTMYEEITGKEYSNNEQQNTQSTLNNNFSKNIDSMYENAKFKTKNANEKLANDIRAIAPINSNNNPFKNREELITNRNNIYKEDKEKVNEIMTHNTSQEVGMKLMSTPQEALVAKEILFGKLQNSSDYKKNNDENLKSKLNQHFDEATNLGIEESWAKYKKDIEDAQNTDYNLWDKTGGRLLGGMLKTANLNQGPQVKDENGNWYNLPTTQDIKQNEIREQTDNGLLRFTGDVLYNTGRIATSAVLNKVIPGVGSTAYFSSMYMDNYNNARQNGYDDGQAGIYSTISTATELLTEKLLGGTTKAITGGKASALNQGIANGLSKIMNNKGVIKVLSHAGAEATEEFLQEYIDNITKNIVFKENNDIFSADVLSDALYSAAIGGVTGVFGSIGDHSLDSRIESNLLKKNEQNNAFSQNINNESKVSSLNFENSTSNDIFSKQVDEVINGTFDKNNHMTVLDHTPSVLQELGVQDYPITLTANKLDRIMNASGKQSGEYHNLGEEIVKKIPEALQHPLDIVKSYNNSYVLTTDLSDNQNRQIIASIKIDGKGYIDNIEINTNVMTSAYGRNNYDNWMKQNKDNVVYDVDRGFIDNKKLDTIPRLQLPNNSNKLSNDNLTQSSENVKIPFTNNMLNNQNNTQELENSSFNLSENSQKAKRMFGTTNVFSKAGYIIENGEMLDFSDGYIQKEHSDIDNLIDMEDYIKSGAIRISDKSESAVLEIGKNPTKNQLYKIMDFVDNINNKPLTIEMKKGNDNLTIKYDFINSIKVKNDIKNFYENETIPSNVNILRNTFSKESKTLYQQQQEKINNWIENGFIDDINDPSIKKWIKNYPDIFPNEEILKEDNNQDIRLPKAKSQNKINIPIAKELKENSKVLNPIEISNLTKDDANTTPKLPNVNRNKISDGDSKYWNNILEKTDMLNLEQKNKILSEDEVKYYDKITNKESLDKAFERLNKNGQVESTRWFNKESINADATDVAEGWILLKQYADNGDYDSMVEVAKKMRDIGSKAGQTVQAFNIMERMTPEGMVKYAQSELMEAYNQMVKNKSKEWIDNYRSEFDLNPDEVQFIMDNMREVSKMENGYDKRVKLAEIQKIMTDKIPSNAGKKIKSWMRISMLFNPKTQVRNVAGNALIMPINNFGDLFSSYADKLISKKTGVRTTGNVNIKAQLKGFKEGAYQATNDYRKGINTKDMEGNRFEIGEGKSFSDKNVVGRNLNRVESLLNYVMDAGDRMFSQAAFENSLQNQLVLNNTTEITQDMIDIAHTESLQRTWNDNNNYTKFVLNIRKGINSIPVLGKYGLGDVLIPFAKTPANLTKAIVDYSPAGLVNTLIQGNNLRKSLSNGQYTAQLQHQFVQSLGKATAGTMLYVLGLALAKSGITSGESDDDKDTANFLKNTLGISSYSINIGGKSFTYDWAQPIAAPLSITSNIVNSKKKGTALTEAIIGNLDTAGSILLEQSFLTSINEVFNNNDGVISGLGEQILGLPARAIPTFSKQIVDLVDDTQRTSYVYDAPIKTAINSIKAKIPGLSNDLAPVVDTMGREVKRYGGKNNLFNVFLNPANVNTENISESAKEINRLYKEIGDKSVMPRVAPYYINKKGEKIILTPEQKTKFQKESGTIIETNVNKLLNSKEYKNMSDEEKSNVIKNIVDYSYNIAQKEIIGTKLSDTYQKAYEYSKIGNISDYYLLKNSIDVNNKKESISNYLINSNLNDKQLSFLYGNYYSSEEKLNSLVEMKIPIKEFIKLNSEELDSDYNKNGQTISNSKKNKVIKYVNSLDLTLAQKAILVKSTYKSYDRYDKQIVSYINKLDTSLNDKKVLLKTIGFNNYNKDVFNYICSKYKDKEERQKKLKSLGFKYRNGKWYS